ncbi:hypothetical protein FRC06_009849, partial [Ceratobasidium sp. 370]
HVLKWGVGHPEAESAAGRTRTEEGTKDGVAGYGKSDVSRHGLGSPTRRIVCIGVLAAAVRKASGKGECDYGGVGGIRQAIGMRLRSIHRDEYEAGDKASVKLSEPKSSGMSKAKSPSLSSLPRHTWSIGRAASLGFQISRWLNVLGAV